MKQKDNKMYVRSVAGLLITSVVLISLLIVFRWDIFFSQTPFIWALSFAVGLFVYEMIAILIINKKINTLGINDRKIVNVHMVFKMIKIFLFLIVVFAYFSFVKIELKSFILTAFVIYFIYLVLDTMCLIAMENRKKKCNEKLN